MNTYTLKSHLMALLTGATTTEALVAEGTPEALEAVTISAKNFNEITMAARDIHSAMTSTFIGKIRGGAFRTLVDKGYIEPPYAIQYPGKTLEFQIAWDFPGDRIFLKVVTPLPARFMPYQIPLEALVQDYDTKQCRRIFKWVHERVASLKS